jgi:hypothetical protein
LSERVVFGESYQHADTRNPLGLLGASGERPCRRPAKDSDKPTPL